jgi:hypothetical protein
MIIEMQVLEHRSGDFIAAFKKAEAKNLRLYAQDASQLRVLKKSQLALLTNIVNKIKSKDQICYHHFIKLYECVEQSQLLNIQSKPWWDSIWRKRNTETMQTALGLIRSVAADVLVEKAERLAYRDGANLIDKAMKEKLFAEHRSYWTFLGPRTLNYLNAKCDELYSQDRHSRGIWTPTPYNQYNGWVV